MEAFKTLKTFKTTMVASIAAFLIGSASAAPVSDLIARPLKSESALKFSRARDPGAPAGYSRLGIAKINGQRIAVYAFRNGAKLDDAGGQGHGSADIFDSAGHLKRRFTYRENLHSPPQITEFIYMPER